MPASSENDQFDFENTKVYKRDANLDTILRGKHDGFLDLERRDDLSPLVDNLL